MKSKLFLIILLVITLVTLLPQLQIPWMLIDDGENARAAAELSNHFSRGDFEWLFKMEAQNGYFRPTYWVSHILAFGLFGNNAVLHHFSHLLLYLVTVLLIYLLTKEISGSRLGAFFAGLFYLLFAPAAENFYRLGTNEPAIVLFILGALYGLVKFAQGNSVKYFLLSVLFLIPAWFSKPLAVALLPFSLGTMALFYYFREEKGKSAKRGILFFFIANFVLALALQFVFTFYGYGGGYGSQYVIDLNSIKTPILDYIRMITGSYGLIFYLLLISFVIRLFSLNKINKKQLSWESKWELSLLFLSVIFLVIQAPWPYLMGRYLLPTLIGLTIVFGIELSALLKFGMQFYHQKKMVFIFTISILPLLLFGQFLFTNSREIIQMYQRVVPGENRRAEVVKYLADVAPSNGRIFYDFSDGFVEFFYEMGLHFQILENRSDIKTAYLFLDNGFQFKEGDILVTGPVNGQRYPWQLVKNALPNSKIIKKVDNEWEIIQLTKDEEIQAAIFSSIVPPKNILVGGKDYDFSDDQGEINLPIKDLPIKDGGISFIWKTPLDLTKINKKISLIYQEDKNNNSVRKLLVWADKDSLRFNIWDPWKQEWQSLIAYEQFKAGEDYKVILQWGKEGMILTVGGSHLFTPFYAGINSQSDFIMGSSFDDGFSEKSGQITDITLFTLSK